MHAIIVCDCENARIVEYIWHSNETFIVLFRGEREPKDGFTCNNTYLNRE